MSDRKDKYNFRVPQKALIKNKSKYLIVKRSMDSKRFPGYWDLPGGKLEQGESATQGITREVKEETNLDVRIIKPIFTFIQKEGLDSFGVLVIVYEAIAKKFDVMLSEEHTEYKWVTKSELEKMKAEPFLLELMKEI